MSVHIVENDYTEPIKQFTKAMQDLRGSTELWQRDELVLKTFRGLFLALYQQVHAILVPQKTDKAEKEIRAHVAFVIKELLLPIENKVAKFANTKPVNYKLLKEYTELHDDLMALASFRSLEHFNIYIESVFKITLWRDTLHLFKGLWYYANKMFLDHEVNFIEKQLPTGYGKTMSDIFMICFVLGLNINTIILKVFGNLTNINPCFDGIMTILRSQKFAKVFPYFKQFNGNMEEMFTYYNRNMGVIKIKGSTKENVKIATKKMDVSGVRADYVFLDDIVQPSEAGNFKTLNQDIDNYEREWFKRSYDRSKFGLIVGGTTYSIYDMLSYLKSLYGIVHSQLSKLNKYTRIARQNIIKDNGISVFVCVPKLDYVTDKSTYEKAFPTEQALIERQNRYKDFMAMEQQQPLPPEGTPFYVENLQSYETLPKRGENDRPDYHFATLDPCRTGANYCSMPICSPFNSKHHVIDWLYELRPMKECYGLIVAKIIQHNITKLYIENNIDTSLKELLDKMLHDRGYYSCIIDEVYSTEKKDVKISNAEGDIKAHMVFPAIGIYGRSSPMGTAMEHVYCYSYKTANDYDDSIDSLAMYSKKFISNTAVKYAQISTFRR